MKKLLFLSFLLAFSGSLFAQTPTNSDTTAMIYQNASWKYTKKTWFKANTFITNLSKGTGQRRLMVQDSITGRIKYIDASQVGVYTAGNGIIVGGSVIYRDSMKTTGQYGNTWSSGTGMYLGSKNNASVRFRTNNLFAMVLDSNQRLGLGTSNPVSRFHINYDPIATANYGMMSFGTSPFNGSSPGFFTGSSNGNVIAINAADAYLGDYITCQTAGVGKGRWNANGIILDVAGTLNGQYMQTSGDGGVIWSGGAAFLKRVGTSGINGAETMEMNAAPNIREGFMVSRNGNMTYTTGYVSNLQSKINYVPSGAGSTIFRPVELVYTINAAAGVQSGTATGIFLNATETSLNGMIHNLLDIGTGGGAYVSKLKVDNTGNTTIAGNIIAGGTTSTIRLKGYTVATLPAGVVGDMAYVTDALAPAFLTIITGGGAIISPVFYNGTNWVSH